MPTGIIKVKRISSKENKIMETGTVKFFNPDKGFGFIIQDNAKKDLFVHITECGTYTPQEGEKVEYEVGEGRKGPIAKNVRAAN
jgi:CspA family cold shock protein